MSTINKCDVPEDSLLDTYATELNAYADCYYCELQGRVSLEAYINAFYKTPLFKLERFLLKLFASASSTDQDVVALASNQSNYFALWKLTERTETQILLNAGRTSSWLSIHPQEKGTRLYFGSAVTAKFHKQNGKTEMGFLFSALLGFHDLYSRALLWSAKRRLT